MNAYYLGLDLSTQQLKCTLMSESHSIVLEEAVNFDIDLPEFGTHHGAYEDDDVVTAPTLMWVKAMDLLLARLQTSGYLSQVRGIAGAGQQHGSIYWSQEGLDALATLHEDKTLASQLQGAWTITKSPIWLDASTTLECRSLEDAVGGPKALADLTGSRAYERFTGNQIAKIYKKQRSVYDATVRISLVSSFLATLLLGKLAPVDAAEGSGTNLMNIKTHRWQDSLLKQCGGPSLYEKLALEPVPGGHVLGKVHSYYVKRYGFHPDCRVMPFTGDNSATLASMNLQEGDCVVSLGTSDTVLVYLSQAEATVESHLMAHPTDPSGFMGMLCYKNGSLTRQYVRDRYAQGSWETFDEQLKKRCDKEQVGFYYWMQEIIPFAKGIFRFEQGQPVEEFTDPALNARAIIESQCLSMRVRLQRMAPFSTMKRILATGGASANTQILQILSNVMGLPVYKQRGMNSASLGGALLAKYGTMSQSTSFDAMISQHSPNMLELLCRPDPQETEHYIRRMDEYIRLEASILQPPP